MFKSIAQQSHLNNPFVHFFNESDFFVIVIIQTDKMAIIDSFCSKQVAVAVSLLLSNEIGSNMKRRLPTPPTFWSRLQFRCIHHIIYFLSYL